MLQKIISIVVTLLAVQSFAGVTLKLQPSQPVLLEKQRQVTILSIDLEAADRVVSQRDRMPVNLAVVMDQSGSMAGDRIEQAKEAARTVVGLLGPEDIFSLVTYDDEARTIVPATKLRDKRSVLRQIDRIQSDGNTALFAGVSKGIGEVRKFRKKGQVNRVILLSDGMANVGPSSSAELESLGRSAGKEGITVTTIGLGLGYNEDLMSGLALASDGNHAFVENSQDLAAIFEREIGGVLSVVAQSLQIEIQCPEGVRPIRVLDQDAEIRGNHVTLFFNQMYAAQKKSLLLEVELQAGKQGTSMEVAQVHLAYQDPFSGKSENQSRATNVRFSVDPQQVRQATYKPAVVEAAKAKANIASKDALRLRDQGDYQAAGAVMQKSLEEMSVLGEDLGIPELKEESEGMKKEAEVLSAPASSSDLNRSRKQLKATQYERSSKFSIQK